MQESELYQRWFNLARSKKALQTGGHRLEILREGELNKHRGPDIRHACFKLDGLIYQGAVEFHIHARDWYRHHHHLDQAYGDVLLHLVAGREKDDDAVYHQGSGVAIPTLFLPQTDTVSTGAGSLFCPAASQTTLQHRRQVLQDLALQRFTMKTRQFTQQLAVLDSDHVFYQATMRVWGYPYNSMSFSVLSRKFSWNRIWQWLQQWGHDEQGLYALLAGVAGFLPAQISSEPFLRSIQERFRFLKNLLEPAEMEPVQWIWAGCRPGNHPHLRLAGMVRLLCRHRHSFWNQALEILSARLEYTQTAAQINDLFNFPLNSYWKTHYALGQPCTRSGCKKYFGPQRIQEWLVNVLLPITMARAGLNDSLGFSEYLKVFYNELPQKQSYGQFKDSAIMTGLPARVYVNQGLIQLRDYYCRKQDCSACPLVCLA